MDPVTMAIVASLAVGVAGGATEVGRKVIVDAYEALKAALKQAYGVDSDLIEAVEHLEKKPAAKSRQAGVEEEVKAVKANEDPDILAAAQALLEQIKAQPGSTTIIGDANVIGNRNVVKWTKQRAGDQAIQISQARDVKVSHDT